MCSGQNHWFHSRVAWTGFARAAGVAFTRGFGVGFTRGGGVGFTRGGGIGFTRGGGIGFTRGAEVDYARRVVTTTGTAASSRRGLHSFTFSRLNMSLVNQTQLCNNMIHHCAI